ncbi:SMI1/KNR4 family protein [Streptomyces sp. NPDC049881]|uniref:SMI1/KNR4 family protein n=1 Tax=Streptomyces sp. NPDC049881 TaxID=3155778 RepID=UPI00341CDEBB
MIPDLGRLRELLDALTPAGRPARGAAEEDVRAAEAVVGALPRSYRWWLRTYGSGRGTVLGAEVAVVAPPPHADTAESVTVPWRREEGGLLRFAAEPDGGDAFLFGGASPGGERAVLRRDPFDGGLYPYAESFAGFVAVRAALAAGLRDGPNPAVARLWRTTPGLALPDGVTVYGPHDIAERNATYEVAAYAPGWTLVGDDSGGAGLLMRHHGRDRSSVYLLGLGALGPGIAEDGTLLTGDLCAWLTTGAPR